MSFIKTKLCFLKLDEIIRMINRVLTTKGLFQYTQYTYVYSIRMAYDRVLFGLRINSAYESLKTRAELSNRDGGFRDIQHELLNQHMSESFTRKWFSSRTFQNIDEKIFNDPNGLSSKLNYCTRFPKQRIYELIYRLIGCYYCDSIETGSPCLVCLIFWFLTVLLLFQIIYIMEDFIFHVSISFFRL